MFLFQSLLQQQQQQALLQQQQQALLQQQQQQQQQQQLQQVNAAFKINLISTNLKIEWNMGQKMH